MMTVNDLLKSGCFAAAALPSPDKTVEGAYVGDLLSWVMGKADYGNAWITIMSNVNVIAVASLTDVSCVILAENVIPDDEIKSLALQKNVNILTSQLPIYETAIKLSGMLQ